MKFGKLRMGVFQEVLHTLKSELKRDLNLKKDLEKKHLYPLSGGICSIFNSMLPVLGEEEFRFFKSKMGRGKKLGTWWYGRPVVEGGNDRSVVNEKAQRKRIAVMEKLIKMARVHNAKLRKAK